MVTHSLLLCHIAHFSCQWFSVLVLSLLFLCSVEYVAFSAIMKVEHISSPFPPQYVLLYRWISLLRLHFCSLSHSVHFYTVGIELLWEEMCSQYRNPTVYKCTLTLTKNLAVVTLTFKILSGLYLGNCNV